ncbi:exostosin-1b-like [Penaeus monodon]|uniref:exostosin-1b-like n=1 Tax=Penaeus monodon TaxID=6687 RepID=UPI0018A6FE51|nr:exostosin-1b-like [Penaeus monodon]
MSKYECMGKMFNITYDYEVLLRNSTFCLVPRGRRLGSFRFLEVLQAGCVPVLLANGWELPFSEVIDWSRSALWADERLLLQVPDMVRSINASQILQMRQQTQLMWNQYFSSIQKIVFSTLEIVADRVRRHRARSLAVWNSSPGALAVNLSFSDYLPHFPFYLTSLGISPNPRYTAVIAVTHGGTGLTQTTPLYKLVKNIARSKFVEKIIVVWTSSQAPPTENRIPGGSVPVHVVVPPDRSISARHHPHPLITTDAVFSLDEDVTLTTDELDFAFTVWRTFPERIVGYPARSHHWDDAKAGWSYTSRWTNSYSMVLTGAAVYHRYWQHVYTHQSPSGLLSTVSTTKNCDDILMNFLVSAVIRRPPIKLTQRKQYKDYSSEARWVWTDPSHFHQRSVCLNTFASLLGHIPLKHSNLRLDPVLFKDKVSMQRKKYRQIEKIGS